MPDILPLQPMGNAGLSVILLARDNAAHLAQILDDWFTYLNGLNRQFEVLLVDDGSRDSTGELLVSLASRYPDLRVLRHDAPLGDGAALRTALAEATQPLVAYAVCELGYRPGWLTSLLVEIDKVHLVSGYRTGRPVPRFLRRLGSVWRLGFRVLFSYSPEPLPGWLGWRNHLLHVVARILFGIRNQDVQCPFRLCRRAIFARISIQSVGSFVHIEILAKVNFLGCYVGAEVPLGDLQKPTPLTPRPGTTGEMIRDGWRVFNTPDFGPVDAVFNLMKVQA